MTTYDRTGLTYSVTRRPDTRVAAVVNDALQGMGSVANIGAGTGYYETPNTVVAVEPSRVMIDQRPEAAAPAVQAVAEHLPIGTGVVDSASSSSPGVTRYSVSSGCCASMSRPSLRPMRDWPSPSRH